MQLTELNRLEELLCQYRNKAKHEYKVGDLVWVADVVWDITYPPCSNCNGAGVLWRKVPSSSDLEEISCEVCSRSGINMIQGSTNPVLGYGRAFVYSAQFKIYSEDTMAMTYNIRYRIKDSPGSETSKSFSCIMCERESGILMSGTDVFISEEEAAKHAEELLDAHMKSCEKLVAKVSYTSVEKNIIIPVYGGQNMYL